MTNYSRKIAYLAVGLAALTGGCTNAASTSDEPLTASYESTDGLPESYFTNNDERTDELMPRFVTISEAIRDNDSDGTPSIITIDGKEGEEYVAEGHSEGLPTPLTAIARFVDGKPIAVILSMPDHGGVIVNKVVIEDSLIKTAEFTTTANIERIVQPGALMSIDEAEIVDSIVKDMLDLCTPEIPKLVYN